jgi:predicted enzyme related to lactoylglutathione lyase
MRILWLVVFVLACKGNSERVDPLVVAARACPDDADVSCARPILNVQSLKASQAYYRDALGFTIDWEHEGDFGSVSRGHGVLFMCEGCQGNPGTWVMLFVKNVDELHEEIAAKGAIIRMPPTTMPWGLREMHVGDLDGNTMRFASSVDH